MGWHLVTHGAIVYERPVRLLQYAARIKNVAVDCPGCRENRVPSGSRRRRFGRQAWRGDL